MGLLDNIKGFITNLGKRTSNVISNVLSNDSVEKAVDRISDTVVSARNTARTLTSRNVPTNVKITTFEKRMDDIFKSRTAKTVAPLASTTYKWNKEMAKGFARTYPTLIKGSGTLLGLAFQSNRYRPERAFMNEAALKRQDENIDKLMNASVEETYKYADYLQQQYNIPFRKSAKTYDRTQDITDNWKLAFNREYITGFIADNLPPLAIQYAASYAGGPVGRTIASSLFTGTTMGEKRFKELLAQGKRPSDADTKDFLLSMSVGAATTAADYWAFGKLKNVSPEIKSAAASKISSKLAKEFPKIAKFLSGKAVTITKGVAIRDIFEGLTEAYQDMLPEIAYYLAYDEDKTWDEFEEELKSAARLGWRSFVTGALISTPFSTVAEVVQTNAEAVGEKIYSESVEGGDGNQYEITYRKMFPEHYMDPSGKFVNPAIIDGRISDIRQKLNGMGFRSKLDPKTGEFGGYATADSPFISETESFKVAESLIRKDYATYSEFAIEAKKVIAEALTKEGMDPLASSIVANNVVGPNDAPIIGSASKAGEETVAESVAVEYELSEEIPEDSEYTEVFDDVRFSDPVLTGASDILATELSVDADPITNAELPATVDETQKAINDVLVNETAERTTSFTSESYIVAPTAQTDEPTSYEVTFDRTQNGFDVVNVYEYIDGERSLVDTMTLQQARETYGTEDSQEIAMQISGIVDPMIVDEAPTQYQEEGVDTQQYSRAQGYARRISQYQRLLNNTKGTFQRNLIKNKISALEKGRRAALNVEYTDTFVTSDEVKEMIKSIPFLKNVSIIELQNMIDMQPGFAYGSYSQAIIQYVKNPHETTLPHEAFHAFADLVLTRQEKEQMLALVRKDYKGITDNILAEEKAAQLFAEYFVSQMKPKTRLQQIFKRIKQLMEEFVGIVPEIEKIFNKTLSPFTTTRIKYAEKMADKLPGIRQKMQGNVLVESSKMFNDKFFARKEFRRQDLIDKLNKKTIAVPEGVRFLMLSTLTSGEFENQATINTNDFKQAVSEETMQVTLIDSDKFTTTGYSEVNQPDGKRTVINTNFAHGRQGHFSNEYDTFTKKDDIEIREIAAGTYNVEGQEQVVDKDTYAVIRKDVKTKEQIEEIGVFALFDSEEEAQTYIDGFEDRVTHTPGLFAHFGWSYDEETKTFFLDEVQSDAMKGKYMKEYYRANKRFIDDEVASIKRIFQEDIDVKQAKIDDINVFLKDTPVSKNKDSIIKLLKQYNELTGYERNKVREQIDAYFATTPLSRYTGYDGIIMAVNENIHLTDSALQKKIDGINKEIQYIKDSIGKEIAKINEKYGEEGWYFRNKNKAIIDRYNTLIKNAGTFESDSSESLIKEIHNFVEDNNEFYKFLDYIIADNQDAFDKFVVSVAAERESLYAKRVFAESLSVKKIASYTTYFEDKIKKLGDFKLTAKQRKEIELSEQFLAYRNDHYKFTVKQAIRKAAQMGAERIAFPSNYTLAAFEGWQLTTDSDIDESERGEYADGEISIGEEIEVFGESGFVTEIGDSRYTVLSGRNIQRYYISDVEDEEVDRIYEEPELLYSITNGANGDEDIRDIVYDLAIKNEKIMSKFKEDLEEDADVEEAFRTYIDEREVDSLFSDDFLSDIHDDAKEEIADLARDNVDIESYMKDIYGYAEIHDDYIYVAENNIYENDFYFSAEIEDITEDVYDYEEHLENSGHQAITRSYDKFIRPYFIKNRGGAEFETIDDFGYYVAPIRPNDVADVILFQAEQTVSDNEMYTQEARQPLGRKITNALADSEAGALVYQKISDVITGGSYPERVPQELRRRALFARMKQYIEEDRIPLETNTREVRLYDIVHNWMREEGGFDPVDFTQETADETGTVVRTAPPKTRKQEEPTNSADLYNAIRVFAYDELSQIRPGKKITQGDIEIFSAKVANDIAVDTKSLITDREKQLIDTNIRDLKRNLKAVTTEKDVISNKYLQQLRYVNQSYTVGDAVPRAYRALYRKNKRKATDEELADIVDAVIEESAIEYNVEEALRYIELKGAQNILDRLLGVYKDDMKTGASRAVRYTDMLKTKTTLISIISEIKKFTRELPAIKKIKADLDIAQSLQDNDYRKAFASLKADERLSYNISTEDFVKRMKDTYLIQTAGGSIQFVDGSRIDNIKDNGGTVKYSLASRAEKEGYNTVDEYLTVITNNQKSIDAIKSQYNAAYNQALMTDEYVDTLRKLNNIENRMNIIAASYPNRQKFLMAMRALELQAMRDVTIQNANNKLALQKKQLQSRITKAAREGREDLQMLKNEYKKISDAKYRKHLQRTAIIQSYKKTYKFITDTVIEKMVNQYAKNAGEKTNLYTMSDGRFNSILAKHIDPLIEDAMIKFAAAKEVNDLIESKQIINADNLRRALELKTKLNTTGRSFRDATAKQLANVDLHDMAEYHDILMTIAPESELLPERILEKAMRGGLRPQYDFNVFITEKDFVQTVAASRGISEQDAWTELLMRKQRGYSKLNDFQGISHASDADLYTDYIMNTLVDMMMASNYEYETFRKKYQKLYRTAVKSRFKSPLHRAMSEASRFVVGSKEMDTDMLIHDFLDAFDRTKTAEENEAMSDAEKMAITDALLMQMTQQEQELALWLRNEALFEAGKFLQVYENVRLKDNYITYHRKKLKDFLRTSGLFVGLYKYITQNDTIKDNVFLEIGDDLRKHKHISTRHMFNYAKKRYSIGEGSSSLNDIILPYFKDFTRHKQFIVNLPRVASMVDILGLDTEKITADNIEGFWRRRLEQLRGSYKFLFTPGTKPTAFARLTNSALNVYYLFGRFIIQSVSPLSDILSITRDVISTRGLLASIPILSLATFQASQLGVVRMFRTIGIDLSWKEIRNLEKLTEDAIGIVGRTFIDEITAIDKTIPQRVGDTMMAGYGLFFAELNRIHLYTLIGKDEIANGEFKPGNLAKYAKQMSRGRYTHGPLSTSPIGGTIEGRIMTKYITFAIPEMMVQANLVRDILRKTSDYFRENPKYSSVTGLKLVNDFSRVTLGLAQAGIIFEIFIRLIDSLFLPENAEDDDERQKIMRRIISEAASTLGVIAVASRAYKFLLWGHKTISNKEDEVDQLAFVDETKQNPYEDFANMFVSIGNSGVPVIDFMIDTMYQAGVLYFDAMPFGQTKTQTDEALEKANYNLFNKVMPIIGSTAVRTNIRNSVDGKYRIGSAFAIEIPFLSAKERDRDISEELFGHRFGMDDNQKEAYKLYKSIDALSTSQRFDVAKKFIDSDVKEDNELGKQLRIMIANEGFTKEQKNILTGISRTYYKGETAMSMTDGFRAYALKKYTDNITDENEKAEFLINFAQTYVENEIATKDVLSAYTYLSDNDIKFNDQEETFYTISSFDEKRAKIMAEYVESTSANADEANKKITSYAIGGMFDTATTQAMRRIMKEKGW